MNPKEQAKKIVDIIGSYVMPNDNSLTKECCISVINEMQKFCGENTFFFKDTESGRRFGINTKDYWDRVKLEIKKH